MTNGAVGRGGDQTELEARRRVRQMIVGCVDSQIVGVAARLRIADHLAAGHRSSDALAEATGAHPGALLRFLRACVAVGLLDEDEPDLFGLTPLGECIRSDGGSLRNFAVTYASPGFWLTLGEMSYAVSTGASPAQRVFGKEMWEYYRDNPEERAYFSAFMAEYSTDVVAQIAGKYDVSTFDRIVDVGGSSGDLLAAMLETSPKPSGVLFDRSEALGAARETMTARGLANRVELVAGDFFSEVPPGGDLYLLKHVVCDWNDEQVRTILANCHRAAQPASRLLVADLMLPADYRTSQVYIDDLAALLACGHRLRSVAEVRELLTSAGYEATSVVELSNGVALLEATRIEEGNGVG